MLQNCFVLLRYLLYSYYMLPTCYCLFKFFTECFFLILYVVLYSSTFTVLFLFNCDFVIVLWSKSLPFNVWSWKVTFFREQHHSIVKKSSRMKKMRCVLKYVKCVRYCLLLLQHILRNAWYASQQQTEWKISQGRRKKMHNDIQICRLIVPLILDWKMDKVLQVTPGHRNFGPSLNWPH
jgi:hypothetical protein